MSVFIYVAIHGPLIDCTPNKNLGIVVCIPLYDEKDVNSAIQSILYCKAAPCHVEIIALLNESERDIPSLSQLHRSSYNRLKSWSSEIARSKQNISLFPISITGIPQKKAGVGLARKLAMDEGVLRLKNSDSKLKLICSCDADSIYPENYLQEVWSYFDTAEGKDLCSIYFEHPLDLIDEPQILRAIIQYELHLRYYKNMRQCIGLPFAFYTLGSCMAFRSEAYKKLGGMYTRKAG
ncbi:MAG: hypothetical protein R3250_16325, partial [Melioribacteraceae bacterium]|nr:hypothetical protein [Melioribacteraceae bacterium]